MSSSELPALARLDQVRSAILNLTLRVPALRVAFCSRSLRLLGLFALSFAISLSLALYFPLWVLALGPAIYGVPHIFASIRYFHYTAAGSTNFNDARRRSAVFILLSLILLAVFSFRMLVSVNVLQLHTVPLSEWKGSSYVEFIGLLAAFAGGAWIYRKRAPRILGGLALIAPLAFAFMRDPAATIGAMVLIHNFVAFGYWIHASKKSSEKAVAWLGLLAISAVTVALFAGAFDPWLATIRPAENLDFARLSMESLGRTIVPGTDNPRLWAHAAIAYAFGQSLHYFVWLKAIPDQFHYHPMPTSFRQCARLLERDFGKRGLAAIGIVLLASLGTWIFLRFSLARMIYFSLAAFHGYLEIAGLALATRGKASQNQALTQSAARSPSSGESFV